MFVTDWWRPESAHTSRMKRIISSSLTPQPYLFLCSSRFPRGRKLPLLPGWRRSPWEGASALLHIPLNLLPHLLFLCLHVIIHGHLPALPHRQEVRGHGRGGVARQASIQDQFWLLLILPLFLLLRVFWQDWVITRTLKSGGRGSMRRMCGWS